MSTNIPIYAEVFENQRYFPIKGWGKKMLPTDRWKYSSKDGKEERTDLSQQGVNFNPPPPGFEWKGFWTLWMGECQTDADGWAYAVDFPATYGPKMSKTDFVRRRRWLRALKIIDEAAANRMGMVEENGLYIITHKTSATPATPESSQVSQRGAEADNKHPAPQPVHSEQQPSRNLVFSETPAATISSVTPVTGIPVDGTTTTATTTTSDPGSPVLQYDSVPSIEGNYECHVYDSGDGQGEEGVKTNFHYVTIRRLLPEETVGLGSPVVYSWENKQGDAWTLIPNLEKSRYSMPRRAVFFVGSRCTHFASGHHECVVEFNTLGKPIGVYGPGGILYDACPPGPSGFGQGPPAIRTIPLYFQPDEDLRFYEENQSFGDKMKAKGRQAGETIVATGKDVGAKAKEAGDKAGNALKKAGSAVYAAMGPILASVNVGVGTDCRGNVRPYAGVGAGTGFRFNKP